MLSGLIGAVVGLVGKAIDKAIPDADRREELKSLLIAQIMTLGETELRGAVRIISAEAEGESWIQRNWRPLTMLTFVSLIVARWLGFSASGISEALELKLLGIVEIGLGGYVVGRSIEKIAPAIADALRR